MLSGSLLLAIWGAMFILDVCHCPPESNKPNEASNLRVSGSSSQLIDAVKFGDDDA